MIRIGGFKKLGFASRIGVWGYITLMCIIGCRESHCDLEASVVIGVGP